MVDFFKESLKRVKDKELMRWLDIRFGTHTSCTRQVICRNADGEIIMDVKIPRDREKDCYVHKFLCGLEPLNVIAEIEVIDV